MATTGSKRWPQGLPSVAWKPLNWWGQLCEGDEIYSRMPGFLLSSLISFHLLCHTLLSQGLQSLTMLPGWGTFLEGEKAAYSRESTSNTCRGQAVPAEEKASYQAPRGCHPQRKFPDFKSWQPIHILNIVTAKSVNPYSWSDGTDRPSFCYSDLELLWRC